jgi:hypothetical protein
MSGLSPGLQEWLSTERWLWISYDGRRSDYYIQQRFLGGTHQIIFTIHHKSIMNCIGVMRETVSYWTKKAQVMSSHSIIDSSVLSLKPRKKWITVLRAGVVVVLDLDLIGWQMNVFINYLRRMVVGDPIEEMVFFFTLIFIIISTILWEKKVHGCIFIYNPYLFDSLNTELHICISKLCKSSSSKL